MLRTVVTLIAIVLLLGHGSAAKADVIVSTSFELEPIGSLYIDTGDASMDHDLVNNFGQSRVDSTIGGPGILGFDASYRNTRNAQGLTDGDFVGVTSFATTVGAFTDGDQGYQLSDTDGVMAVRFDVVTIAGLGSIKIELDVYVQQTGWESEDSLRVFATVDGNETDLVNTIDQDIDTLNLEGRWETVSTIVSGSTAFLTVELDSNSGNESVYLDRVSFSAVVVPEPSYALLLIGGMIGCGIRRTRRSSRRR